MHGLREAPRPAGGACARLLGYLMGPGSICCHCCRTSLARPLILLLSESCCLSERPDGHALRPRVLPECGHAARCGVTHGHRRPSSPLLDPEWAKFHWLKAMMNTGIASQGSYEVVNFITIISRKGGTHLAYGCWLSGLLLASW